jgi:LuxR family maltose regulon positive regulatory protein
LRLLPLIATTSPSPRSASGCTSKHTVKTQAVSIYRKLGASSRSEAVQRVQEVGLLAG